jgi:GGDEF domain-containing protein
MSLQGSIVIVAEKPDGSLVQAFTAAGAFPVVEARWTDAANAVASIKPSAVVLAEPDAPPPEAAQALEQQISASESYVPVVARMREDGTAALANALPVAEDTQVERLIARLASALRLRALHATVLGRARLLKAERNIVAELPDGDPIEDATVMVVGRGRLHPTLSVAVGERMGVIGAMSVDLAARCLNVRDIDGIVIGDGLSPRMVVALLVVLGEDARFRELPVAMLGPEERVDELPNLIHARDPHMLIERLVPLVRQRALEARLKRLLKSIDSKGMLDPRTGLLNADAFGRDFARAIDDANERGVGLSVARFSFDDVLDLRTSLDAARLVSRLMRSADFACRQDDGSIVTVFSGIDLKAAHVVARRLASVIKHTLLGSERKRETAQANVTLATFKPGDTPITLMSRIASRTVAAE